MATFLQWLLGGYVSKETSVSRVVTKDLLNHTISTTTVTTRTVVQRSENLELDILEHRLEELFPKIPIYKIAIKNVNSELTDKLSKLKMDLVNILSDLQKWYHSGLFGGLTKKRYTDLYRDIDIADRTIDEICIYVDGYHSGLEAAKNSPVSLVFTITSELMQMVEKETTAAANHSMIAVVDGTVNFVELEAELNNFLKLIKPYHQSIKLPLFDLCRIVATRTLLNMLRVKLLKIWNENSRRDIRLFSETGSIAYLV